MRKKTNYYDNNLLSLLDLPYNKKYKNTFIVKKIIKKLYNKNLSIINIDFHTQISNLIIEKNKQNTRYELVDDKFNTLWNSIINNSLINNILYTTDLSNNNIINNNISENTIINNLSSNIISHIYDLSDNIINNNISENTIINNLSSNIISHINNLSSNITSHVISIDPEYHNLSNNDLSGNIISSITEDISKIFKKVSYKKLFINISKIIPIFECKKIFFCRLNYNNKGKIIKNICI